MAPAVDRRRQATMVQRDKGAAPDSFETGLPPAQSGEDVPRWLVSPRLAGRPDPADGPASIRHRPARRRLRHHPRRLRHSRAQRLADGRGVGLRLGDERAVARAHGHRAGRLSGCSIRATSPASSLQRLPGPVQRTVAWMESKGWGQRVLLSGGSGGLLSASSGGGSRPSARREPAARARRSRGCRVGARKLRAAVGTVRGRARRATRSARRGLKSQDPTDQRAPAPAPAAGGPRVLPAARSRPRRRVPSWAAPCGLPRGCRGPRRRGGAHRHGRLLGPTTRCWGGRRSATAPRCS